MKEKMTSPNAGGYQDQNEKGAGPHPKVKGYTGPFKYKDKGKGEYKIDTVTKYMLEDMKTFKNAKYTNTEWLTKENPVRQATDAEYHPHKGQEEI